MEKQQESAFARLSAVNVSEQLEKKGSYSYLSWPYAVAELRKLEPSASWEVKRFGDLPFLQTECGFFVEVAVTVSGVTLSQLHPVLDGQNRTMMAPSAFDINRSIQRALVKAIALHGLGLNIFAGEDLPLSDQPGPEATRPKAAAAKKATQLKQVGTGLSTEQQDKIKKLIDETGADLARLLDYFNVQNLADIRMKIVRLIQGSDQWHRHRILYRNASETAAVMGLSPWLTPYGLWEIKTGRRTQECNFVMQRGLELEPLARQAYERDRGAIMEPAVMVDGDYSASLDGLTFDGKLLLEVKCPYKGHESGTWKEAMVGKVEPHYMVQVQHQLMVSGAERCHFYVFDGKDGILVEVLPDVAMFDQIRAAWDDFWKFVVSGTPPPISAKDTVIREDQVWSKAASAFITAKEAAEVAAKAADEAKAKLIALASHNSELGYGVSVCRFWKGRKNSQEEVRVTVLKQGEERC